MGTWAETKIMYYFIFKCLVGLIIVIVVLGVGRTWQMEHSKDQTRFLQGIVPDPALDGLLNGTVPGHKVSWIGKKFNAADQTGINLFNDPHGVTGQRYPFKTSVTKGARDKNLNVLAINYDIAGNPFWLRLILDEVVQVGQGQYLGKLQLRIIPGLPFTLGYFELKK